MKKLLLVAMVIGLLISFSGIVNAEMPITEGFGGFQWGTPIREFLTHFPTAEPLYKSGGEVDQILKVTDKMGVHLYGFENGKYTHYQRWVTKEEFDRLFKELQIKYGKPNEVDLNSERNYYGWSADQKKELRIELGKFGQFVNIYLMWYRPGYFPFHQGGVLYVSLIR